MLELETHIRLDDSIPKSRNLTGRFTEDDLRCLGDWVYEGYDRDERSREHWVRRNQAAMDLALQLQKEKSFPWPNCSNINFPLVTIAALQFHARAYPALVDGKDVVKFRVPTGSPTKADCERAYRVGDYMSYQVLEEDQSWEEQHDRLLIQLPIVGSAFKKSQYDSPKAHNCSELVDSFSLVMDYYAKSVESCARKTHIIPLYRNEIYEKVRAGVWEDVLEEPWYKEFATPFTPAGSEESDRRQGFIPPQGDDATPFTFLEQHCWRDFDQDGYAEPYIITVEANSRCVVRIVARWEASADVERNSAGQVIRIRATEYFTKYGLIPSPDGGIYDLGFGCLLGPLNESVNSLVNMLTDSGTMSVASGGFLSRGVKLRGGTYAFDPFSWNRVDSTGDDLRKGIVELPVREPSAVLFTLLSFLVNYTQRISGSTDALVGENPGQNTPAATQASMVEQGQKIYNALFKRVWRCMKEEFKKLYILNARFLPASKPFAGGTISREDFLGDPSRIIPCADPNITSDQMRLQLALTIADRAHEVGGYDTEEAERRLLRAMKVEGIDTLYPGLAAKPPGVDPKLQIAQMRLQGQVQVDAAKGQREQQMQVLSLMEESRLNDAHIAQMEAQAALFAAQADAEPVGHQIALFDSMIGAAKARNDSIKVTIDSILRALELHHTMKQAAVENTQTQQELDQAGASSATA